MEVFEAIKRRKSVRKYLDKQIPDDVFNRVMDAARSAPSASNRQEWRFVAVKEKSTKRELAKIAGDQNFIAEAAVVLVCCGIDDGKIMHCGQPACPLDVTIAIDHITLAATAEGLGSCWIGHFEEEPVKRLLAIPKEVRVIELLPIGYPADDSIKEKNRLPLSAIVMHEKWRP
jgi:nitroreductase